MKRALIQLLWLGFLWGQTLAASAQTHRVRIATELGDIDVSIDAVHAPATAANFLKYVDLKYYDRGIFHRTVTADNQPNSPVKIAVIQGGIDPARALQDFPPIALERTSATGLTHLAGTISMARDGPDSATSDFFICVQDEPSLDFGGARNPDRQCFAAFGQVIRGMQIVRRIQGAKAQGQTLTPAVRILSIRRIADAPIR